jgi:small subunit ribosomal protein S6
LREYETTIIVQPEISDEGTAAIFERLQEVLDEHDSTRLLCENLGKRKLAYEIRKFHKGHYHILSFLGDGQAIPGLERVLRLNESILRFMTIQTNPNVADIEARKVEAAEVEAELTRKAAERAAREEEEAKARLEIERVAREEEEARALAAAKAEAEAGASEAAEPGADESEATPVSDTTPETTPEVASEAKGEDSDAPASDGTPDEAKQSDKADASEEDSK